MEYYRQQEQVVAEENATAETKIKNRETDWQEANGVRDFFSPS